ncbi:hypothetical protein Mapa_003437 [Marchantia paleacea]|nr:hypothetical protein Mapa_003437 [Marchantia paleacea]
MKLSPIRSNSARIRPSCPVSCRSLAPFLARAQAAPIPSPGDLVSLSPRDATRGRDGRKAREGTGQRDRWFLRAVKASRRFPYPTHAGPHLPRTLSSSRWMLNLPRNPSSFFLTY